MAPVAEIIPPAEPPTLGQIAQVFTSIGLQSFGGGMTAWVHREVVRRRGWLSEQQFLGGLALSQITPGANAVNLAVFIGTSLRGRMGALAALVGMLLVPVIVVLLMGAAFVHVRDVPGVESAMVGLGAAAIGLNLANGVRLSRRGIRGPASIGVAAIMALAIGVARLPLLPVLLVMIPLSLVLAGRKK